MRVWHKAALVAHLNGYRVHTNGILFNPDGRRMYVKARKSDNGYPRFTVYLADEKRGVRIPVHKFAALCFYGVKTFSAQCIRHMNDDRTDFSYDNIKLGTNVQNMQDRCPEHRKRIASAAGKASAVAGKRRVEENQMNQEEIQS